MEAKVYISKLSNTAFFALTVTCLLLSVNLTHARKLQKRNAYELCNLINYYTNRSCLDYYTYGCFCGLRSEGTTPLDNVDKCCKKHDACYDVTECYRWSSIVTYTYECDDETRTCECVDNHDKYPCERSSCECDRVFVECVALAQYNESMYDFDTQNCPGYESSYYFEISTTPPTTEPTTRTTTPPSTTAIDKCSSNLHNCSIDAKCVNKGAGEYECICKSGFMGDGYSCSVCENKNLDIVFVLDRSGSVCNTNFNTLKVFVKNLIRQFAIGPNDTQIGVVTYASSVTVDIHLNEYTNESSVLNAVDNITYSDGGTRTHSALHAVRTQVLTAENGDRDTSPNVVIVITDGQSSSRTSTLQAAEKLQNVSKVMSVGVGSDVNHQELLGIASGVMYRFHVNTYEAVSKALTNISDAACDNDECLNGDHTCDVNAKCTNLLDGHNCTCNEVYYGDGYNCTAICPDGWQQYGSKCYYFSIFSKDWADAGHFCQLFSAKLAEPRTRSASNFIIRQGRTDQTKYWLGISDIFSESHWIYSSNATRITFNDWALGQPNQGRSSNCICTWPRYNSMWVDEPCSSSYRFVCERPRY